MAALQSLTGRLVAIALTGGLITMVGAAGRAVQSGTGLQLTLSAGAHTPGGVVLLTVTPADAMTALEGQAFGRTLEFWRAANATDWQTLVGIPLTTKPATYEITVRAKAAGEAATTSVSMLAVGPAQFATRRIRVSDRFANPPASAAERIAREAKTLAALFARSSSPRIWDGPFIAPVPGEATSSFGRLTILNGRSGSRHQGADFRAAEGTPVTAPNGGTVVLADDYYFSGNTVVLDHGAGLYSLFAHFSRIAVTMGTRVDRGDTLGQSGATGRVTGPHLHWAVRLRGDSVDPLALMKVLGGQAPGSNGPWGLSPEVGRTTGPLQ